MSLVITNVRLIDGTGAALVSDQTVVIDGQRIQAVGPSHQISLPEGADVIDASGMTLMPGLIDCHDHLVSQGYDLASRWGLNEPLSLRHLRTADVVRQTLEAGYTTVRDAGGLDLGFKLAVEEGVIPGPRLLLAITIISPTGGIGDRISPSGHRPSGPISANLPMGVADGVDGIRAKVREVVRSGADVVKFATTGGASSRPGHGPRDLICSRDEIQAVVEETHALGRRVMCHALAGPGLRMAIEAGVDSIEHGTHLDEDPDLFHMMEEKGIFYIPTFTVYVYHRRSNAPHVKARAEELYLHHIRSLQQALAAGVKVAAGTDAGGHVHGNNAQELECLVEAGMPPIQTLQAATGWAADCLGLDGDIGTVLQGKLADLLVIDGDPLQDITVLQDRSRIKLVLKEGEIRVDRR